MYEVLGVIQLLVKRMGHLKKDRLAEQSVFGLLFLSQKTVLSVSVYRPDSLFQEQLGVQRSNPCKSK